MKLNFEQHCAEESLELYAMGKLEETEAETLEEHILICEDCCGRLQEWDRFVHSMKVAAAKLRMEPESAEVGVLDRVKSWFTLPAPALAAAAMAVCAVVFIATVQLEHRAARSAGNNVPFAMALSAERGGSISAPAGRILDLSLDARGLTLGSTVRAEVVNAVGNPIQTVTVPQSGETLKLHIGNPLTPGSYFIRLYGGISTDPSREFALRVQ